MKLLYLSVHAILEYDECKLFNELGIDWFSLGSYIDPQKPVDPIRPALDKKVNPDLLSIAPMRDKLTKEFVDNFDVIVIMHGNTPDGNWIEQNWSVMRHKRVIWRTIGQSTGHLEKKMEPYRADGLQIVRYSPREEYIPNYIGKSAMIRFYKDPQEFDLYNGAEKQVITFAQNIISRGEYCHYELFKEIVGDLPGKIYGPKNEETGQYNGGFLTYEEMRQKYRDSRVYLYLGTQPASYTLTFIEAWMTGIPVIALGPALFESNEISRSLYEIGDLINNFVDGICANEVDVLQKSVVKLLEDPELCKAIGREGKKKAIGLFGKETIKSQWKQFLGV